LRAQKTAGPGAAAPLAPPTTTNAALTMDLVSLQLYWDTIFVTGRGGTLNFIYEGLLFCDRGHHISKNVAT